MSDFIPRQMVIEILDNLCRKCGNKDMAFALDWAAKEIQNLPQYDTREAATPYLQSAIDDVVRERRRQIAIWGPQNDNSYFEFVSILGEEYGELCEAVNETCFDHPKRPDRGGADNVYKEACHVAAVAVKMMERINRSVYELAHEK